MGKDHFDKHIDALNHVLEFLGSKWYLKALKEEL
jgi:hypothetical protein